MRSRICLNGDVGDIGCHEGTAQEFLSCNNRDCPKFSSWSSWSICSTSCGRGLQTKARECINGEVGLEGCLGSIVETIECTAGVSFFSEFLIWFLFFDMIRYVLITLNGSPGANVVLHVTVEAHPEQGFVSMAFLVLKDVKDQKLSQFHATIMPVPSGLTGMIGLCAHVHVVAVFSLILDSV